MSFDVRLISTFTKGCSLSGDWEVISRFSKNRLVVEIGTYAGLGAILFSRWAEKVVTVDNYSHDFYEHNFANYEAVRNYLALYKNIEAVKSDSVEYLNGLPDESIDTLFIDGDHSYNGVSRDFNAGVSKVKRGGVIMFHDYSDLNPDIIRFVDETMKSNPEKYQFIPNEGGNSVMAVFVRR